jgi:riboflavin kinase/FMN adenylyltransferase
VIDFSVDISKLTGEAFIQRCCSMFDIQSVVVGEDFRCGHKADTGVNELKEIVPRICNNATVEVPDTYKLSDGTVDSSTLVRESLTQGKVAQIIGQLGRYYILDLHSLSVNLEDSSLQFSVESVLQLLPPPGLYETVMTLKNGLKVPTETVIDKINVTIKSQMESLKSYDYLEFIKELT